MSTVILTDVYVLCALEGRANTYLEEYSAYKNIPCVLLCKCFLEMAKF